ncbi:MULTISPECIES: acyl-CoA thioesterase [Flavobacteriaceae]|uniref:acyl-CoA thioesterase n=1 Tax=Flavobacteriaceae TaxID=49546 RepID=UPI00234BD524|nr:acyl-CoA thioesterase [Muricauda sp. SP22]MDC6363621.1 acyl-CoA thioesterase [Muricauda sp. SP22]
MKKVLKSKVKIRFQDCDPFNHLNNSRYIDYFINAREEQLLENYNLNVFEDMLTTGNTWVVTSNQIQYLSPVNTGDTVIIESQLNQFSDTNLLVEMRMWNEEETTLKSVIWVRFTHFNIKTKKTGKHASKFMELFDSIVSPIETKFFEERCINLLKQLKNA